MALLAAAGERAAARPERPFSGAAELAALVPALPPADAALLLQRMVDGGELVAGEGGYAPAGAGVLGDEQAALAERILALLGAAAMAPPTLATLAEELRRPPRELAQILDVLARRGDVVRLDRDLWFLSAAVDDARATLTGLLEGGGEVTLAGFRDAAGCGRRNAQALLEHFDREGLTLRRGDVRVARRRRG
jgi:selenocysteine-specific elongation factor